ncbi:uncharacterized protein LOC141607287 [Silene latifolia]|uniref:uncharacterized protein LOC141607287 n=1 Tax=Silene latifolia TaxID=37657 RepID=UPI003D77F1DB
MTDEPKPAVEDHDLDLSLGLSSTRSLNSNNKVNNFQLCLNQKVLLNPDFRIVSNHEEDKTMVGKQKQELKRKVGNVCDNQNDVVGEEEEGVSERRRKVINIGSKSSFCWGGNAGGFQVYQGQNGNLVGVNEGNAGNRSSGSSESSSGFSESYHTSSNAGGNNSDTSSNSSHHLRRLPSVNLHTASPSVKQTVSSQEDTHLNSLKHNQCSRKITSTNSKDKEPSPTPQSRSTSPKAPKFVPGKPPKPSRQMSQQSVLLPQMPCVSATGNGPDGKTISGFLYKYSKTEVSIVCVCHGASFTPSGFVEHAGGVDIEHPLKHIRVVPFAVT